MNEIERIKQEQEEYHILLKFYTGEFFGKSIFYSSYNDEYYEDDEEYFYSPKLEKLDNDLQKVFKEIIDTFNKLEYSCPCLDCNKAFINPVISEPYEVDPSTIVRTYSKCSSGFNCKITKQNPEFISEFFLCNECKE